jgi:hypothetical protein
VIWVPRRNRAEITGEGEVRVEYPMPDDMIVLQGIYHIVLPTAIDCRKFMERMWRDYWVYSS